MRDLAKLMGRSQSVIEKLENGRVQTPTLQTALEISRALRIPMENIALAASGQDPDEARPPEAEAIEAEAEKALEFLSQFIKSKKPPR